MPSLEPLSNDMNLEDFDDKVVEGNLSTHLYGDGEDVKGGAFDKWAGFGSTDT